MTTLVVSPQVNLLYPAQVSSLPSCLEHCLAANDRLYHLSRAQVQLYKIDGYLILPKLLTAKETTNVIAWTNEVKSWDGKTSKQYLQYDENTEEGTVRCSSENFVSEHQGFADLLSGERLTTPISDLHDGEDVYLFKEKINYKMAKAGGYDPHIDASSYEHLQSLKNKIHTTLLIAVEEATIDNGCLEVVPGSHVDGRTIPIPTVGGKTITDEWSVAHEWKPVPLEPGDALIFDSYLAHRSGPNYTDSGRACLYATYTTQRGAENVHREYYEHRRKYWPATANRIPDQDYSVGAGIYAWATPLEQPSENHDKETPA